MTRLLDSPERFGPLPHVGADFIGAIERSGLVGRGGARFPVGTKWRAVAQRSGGRAVIVVNGAEGEPRSQKDRLLMTTRPHLVLDGSFIAARVLRARRVILYIGERHEKARHAMLRALHERTEPERGLVTFAAAPARYVAGAETAAIHFLNEGIATPTTAPPLPFEQGVDRAPTLVQNVETLAHIALIARGAGPPRRSSPLPAESRAQASSRSSWARASAMRCARAAVSLNSRRPSWSAVTSVRGWSLRRPGSCLSTTARGLVAA